MSGEVWLLTVGHGRLPEGDFARLLAAADVELVVDVRSHPGSRRNPQFNRGELDGWLPTAGIDYRWDKRLGGRRRPRNDSAHVGLANPGFRGYADHMESEAFRAALGRLLDEATRTSTAVMCAESVWWRCHRRLLADTAVLVCGVTVRHLFHDGRLADHRPTETARVAHDRLVYDRGADRPFDASG